MALNEHCKQVNLQCNLHNILHFNGYFNFTHAYIQMPRVKHDKTQHSLL